MKIAILRNKNINKLSKNEYDVYNALHEKMKNCNYFCQVIWLVIKVKTFITK